MVISKYTIYGFFVYSVYIVLVIKQYICFIDKCVLRYSVTSGALAGVWW